MRYLLLFQDEAFAINLIQWLKVTLGVTDDAVVMFRRWKEFTPFPTIEGIGVNDAFAAVADWIEAEISDGVMRAERDNSLVLTDLCGRPGFRLDDLDPMGAQDWLTVAGMLILAYPDIKWLFVGGSPWDFATAPARTPFSAHFTDTPAAAAKAMTGYAVKLTTLFDGFGLRNAVRRVTGSTTTSARPQLQLRDRLAVAVDEEQNYAGMHAYIAYRFNLRAHSITTSEGMRGILHPGNERVELLLEDLFLEFPDASAAELSDLEKRDCEFPALTEARSRLVVTTGYRLGAAEGRHDNIRYLETLRNEGKWNRLMHKPLGGIFDVWNTSGLARRYPKPLMPRPNNNDDADSHHSAPGRLIAISDRLLKQARSIPIDASLFDLLKRAVLAGDALELLGGKTPTMALQALLLKHESEVMAECQFLGMQHHVDVEYRAREVRKEVELLTSWFGPTARHRSLASRNAELSILSRLVEVFQSRNRFDEDQILQGPIRRLHRQLRFQKYPAVLRPLGIVPWYAETLVTSFPLFMLAMVGWIVVLGLAFKWLGGISSYDQAFVDSFSTFLSVQPPSDPELWNLKNGWNGAFSLIALTIVLGFVHLGIFISYLYSLLSRR